MPVKSVQLNVLSNSKAARADLQEINDAANKLGGKVVKVKAGVDDQTTGPFNVIERKVHRLNGEDVIIKVKADDADADIKMDKIELQIKRLDGKQAKVDIKVGTTDLEKATLLFAGFDKAITLMDPEAGTFAKIMASVNLATGLLEPTVAGVTVATLALGSSLLAGGLGLGAFGLALLGPIETNKKFKAALTGVETEVEKWGDSLSKWTLPPIFAALKLVAPLLKDMSPFVKAAASALDVLVGQLSKNVSSTGFANWLKSELPLVKPAIVDIGDAVGHVVVGIMGIFHAFNPEATSMSKGLDDITAKFEKWGTSLGGSSGFKKLMDMFHSETPVVMSDLKALGSTIVHIGSDMADLNTFSNSRSIFIFAGYVLDLVDALAKAHPQLIDDALYVLAFLDAIKKLSAGFMSLKSGIDTLTSVGKAITGIPNDLNMLKLGLNDSEKAASDATGAWGTFGGKLGTVKTGMTNLKSGFNDADTAASDASGTMGTLGGKLSTLGGFFTTVATKMGILRTATIEETGAQEGMDVAMELNPIALVVTAIIALVAIVVILAVKFKAVRDVFIDAWKAILVAAEDVWGWLKTNWPLLLEILLGPIGIAAVEIAKHFSDIKGWAVDVWDWIKANWPYLLGALLGPIGLAAAAIYKNFHDIEGWAEDVWNWIHDNWHDIEGWIEDPIHDAVNFVGEQIDNMKQGFSDALSWIKQLFSSVWSGIEQGARTFVSTLGSVVHGIESAFQTPIKFVVDDVWDTLAGIWNKVAGFVKLPSLPTPHMASGGVVSGQGHGTQDANLVALSSGETVISRQTSQILAPTLRAYGVPGYASGGIPGQTGSSPMSAGQYGESFLKLFDAGGEGGLSFSDLNPVNLLKKGLKFGESALASMASWALSKIEGVVFAPVNALLDEIPGGSELSTMLSDLIKWVIQQLVGDIKTGAGAAQSALASGPAGGATGSEMANGKELYEYLLANVFSGHKVAAAGAIASIWGESTWNPFAQGTGGRGLIGWTPPGTISNAAFEGGMKTQEPAIIAFINSSGDEGVIHEMEGATTVLEAANLWGKGVERYGINDVHSTGLALAAQIMGSATGPSKPVGGVSTSPVTGEQTFNGYSYANGGIIPEPVIGQGLRSGASYRFAENGPERVVPGVGGGGDVYNIFPPESATDPDAYGLRVIQAVRQYKRHHGNQPTNIG